MEKLKSQEFVNNPESFYKNIQDDEDVSDLYKQSQETLSQAEFQDLLEKWDVEIKEENKKDIQEEIEEEKEKAKKYKYGLIRLSDGKVVAFSDSVTYLVNIQAKLMFENKNEKYEIRQIG